MRRLIFVLCAVWPFSGVSAQTTVWQPSPGHTRTPIWPGTAPDPQPVAGPESAKTTGTEWLVAGRPAVGISNVTRPTLTVYSPNAKNTGAAVVVFAGGGYQGLAIDLEGTEVCDWAVSRIANGARGCAENSRSGPLSRDGLAYRFPRDWSARLFGGRPPGSSDHTHSKKRLYPPLDAADKESCRPDFAVPIYPGHLTITAAEWDADQGSKKFAVRGAEHLTGAEKKFGLNPEIPVTSETPPTFILQAEDDPVDSVNNSLAYYIALQQAGVPVEMHLYAHGGHAFGLRRTQFPITGWPLLVETWLATIGMISE